MTAPAAASERAPLGWLLLIPLACLLLAQLLLALHGIVPVLEGSLSDSDAYMRLARVLQLHESGLWFDSREPRINPPDGHVQHWTRALDAVLLAGAWLLQPVLGFADGLHLWGVLISPVLLAVGLVALSWAAAPVLDRDGRLFACLALLMQPTVLAYSSLGRPDHHTLLLVLCITLLGLTIRLLIDPADRRAAVAAGAVAALGIWVSPEALTFVGVAMVTLGLRWLHAGRPALAANRDFASAATVALLLALLIERGASGLLATETDRLSLIHVALFGLIAGFWWATGQIGAHRWPVGLAGLGARAATAGVGMAALGLALVILFPELRNGPLGVVDPLYERIRLNRIVEIQPLIPGEWPGGPGAIVRRLITVVGLIVPAVPFLVFCLVRSRGERRLAWFAIALAMAAFLPLAFYQVRWSIYAQAILVVPYAALVAAGLAVLTRRGGRLALWGRPLLILGAMFWQMLLAAPLPQSGVETAGRGCPLDRIAPIIDQEPRPKTVMAYADYGSELLYRTHHNVLSIPNHRPQPGFEATFRVLTAADDRVARAELARFGVDWILLCPSATERRIFDREITDQNALYHRLVGGTPPPWLLARPLAPDLEGDALLFEVAPTALASRPQRPGEPR